MLTRLSILLPAIVIAAGCATPTVPGDPTVPGKHLVYRDTSGNILRQFDYPSEDICRRVEAVAGRSARCQPTSIAGTMQAQATLRYNPPGFMFYGHYPDMARCQADTSKLADGVELITRCASK